MKLAALDRVAELRRELECAQSVLLDFEQHKEETVPAYAKTASGGDYGRGHRVALLPVKTSVAVSAAKRDVDKVIAELAQLGVTVEPELAISGDPVDEPAKRNWFGLDGSTVGGVIEGR